MAEALIFMGNNVNPDPRLDARSSFKRGHIIIVKPDGHRWGKEEDPATLPIPRRFALLKFKGVAVEALQKYTAQRREAAMIGPIGKVGPRIWQLQHAELPEVARKKLAQTGVLRVGPTVDISWPELRQCLQRADTGRRETADLTTP